MAARPSPDGVDASPTKELFIDILTRDIALIPAIVDLADNCTDGARREGAGDSFEEFEIMIEFDSDAFVIYDNCGGIPLDMAISYAFRFGRPTAQRRVDNEVGRFGVGMKRALFKLGRKFEILSKTRRTDFEVVVDVDRWAELTDKDWTFPFAKPPEENGRFEDPGTEIVVTRLNPAVAERFASEAFAEELKRELSSRLRDPISKGLLVCVNGQPLESGAVKFLTSNALAPAKQSRSYGHGASAVKVSLYAGLGKSDLQRDVRREAGWYVFCNGRLLLEADKTSATVWGHSDDDSEQIPAFHPQFNQFRGIAYFSARDSRNLPWNTTKTGLDTDSALYRSVRLEMIRISRPVINFLNRLKEERESVGEDGPFGDLVVKATHQEVGQIRFRPIFKMPPVARRAASPAVTRITYSETVERFSMAKRKLRARSAKEVGERTFDYFYEAECEDGDDD